MASISSNPWEPAFHVDVRSDRESSRVVPVGELDIATGPTLERELDALRELGARRVVLDLSELSFMDSTGLHVVLRWTQIAEVEGFGFELLRGPDAVQRVFEIAGVSKALPFQSPKASRVASITAGERLAAPSPGVSAGAVSRGSQSSREMIVPIHRKTPAAQLRADERRVEPGPPNRRTGALRCP